jgi:DNA repair protein RecO (recombination protein O)
MQESAHGIILRVYPLTESSLIVQWLTRDQGRISTAAKGARKQKSSFAGKLDIFYEADFSFVRSRRSRLHTLSEVTLTETNTFLRKDLDALTQVAYAAALIVQTTEEETPVNEGYDLLVQLMRFLQLTGAQPEALCAFELLWLQILGQSPDRAKTQLREATRSLMGRICDEGWAALNPPPPHEVTRELSQFLNGFLIYNLGRVPNNRARAFAAGA